MQILGTITRKTALLICLSFIIGTPVVYSQLSVDMLIIGGGGGGGRNGGSNSSGGGGASGGQIVSSSTAFPAGSTLTVVVGDGGFGYRNAPLVNQTNGSISSVSGTPGTWTSLGGNAGGNATSSSSSGAGGTAVNTGGVGAGGRGGIRSNGNTVAGWPVAGANGSSAYTAWGAATSTGQLSGGVTYYAGGGAGGNWAGQSGAGNAAGGLGGGGIRNTAGLVNTGGGGGGANSNSSSGFNISGGNGGSGLVIIRYAGTPVATGGTITQNSGFTYHTFSNSGTFAVNAVLPLNWLSFTADNENGLIRLTWAVSAETNNLRYEVERSADGSVFQSIAFVNASANNSYIKQYTYSDISPLKGKSYYRIKQVDIDGRFAYSTIVGVLTAIVLPIQVFPNPIQDYLIVSLPTGVTGNCECYITNTVGALLLRRKLNAGINKINTQFMKSGLYIVSVRVNGIRTHVEKMLKQL